MNVEELRVILGRHTSEELAEIKNAYSFFSV